jgi:hypothetical protein
MMKTARRSGRPTKTVTLTKPAKISLGLKVVPEIKQLIDIQAKISGRTQSQQAEHLIERAVAYDKAFEAMRTTLEMIERRNVDAALYRLGYRPIRSPKTDKKLWAEPGYPGIELGGFEPWKPGERESFGWREAEPEAEPEDKPEGSEP